MPPMSSIDDVGAEDERLGVGGEELVRQVDVALGVDVAHGDADELEAGSDAGGELVAVLEQQARDLGADGAGAEQRDPEIAVFDHLLPRCVSPACGPVIAGVARQQVGLGLAAHDHARDAVAHRDHGGTSEVVVVARQRPAVGAGRGDGEQVAAARRRRAGSRRRRRCRRSRSACRRCARARAAASETRFGDAHRVVGAVERGAGVVAHAAVDADVAAHGGLAVVLVRHLHVFDRADGVEREPAVPMIERPGSNATTGTGMPSSAQPAATVVGDAGRRARSIGAGRRPSCTRCRSRRRGSARAPARRRAVARARRAGGRPTRANPSAPKICEPMWQCSPRKSSASCDRMRATAAGSVGERRCRTSGLRGRSRGSRACARARRCSPAGGRAARGRGAAAASATRSISCRLSRMIAPTPTATARSISASDLLLPWKPSRAGSAPAASATASSPPLQTSMLRPASRHPARDLDAEERLAGVVDLGASSRRARTRRRTRRAPRRRARGHPPRRRRRAECRSGAASSAARDAADGQLAVGRGRRCATRDPGARALASPGTASHSGASGFADATERSHGDNLTGGDEWGSLGRADPAWSLKPLKYQQSVEALPEARPCYVTRSTAADAGRIQQQLPLLRRRRSSRDHVRRVEVDGGVTRHDVDLVDVDTLGQVLGDADAGSGRAEVMAATSCDRSRAPEPVVTFGVDRLQQHGLARRRAARR